MDKVDESKVAEALEFLKGEREKAARNKLDEAFAIGEYLWREFFKSDPTSATHKGEGSTSYSALIARPELAALGLSKTTLWNYVTVAVEQREFFEAHIQKERLPPSVRTLGFTQRVRLASCKKVSDTLRIAKVAAEQGLSPNAVAQLVKDANAGKSPRKPAERLDEDTKLIIQAAHLVRVASTVDVTSLPDDELRVLASMVTAQLGDQAEALEGRLTAEAATRTRPSTPAPIEDEIDFDEMFTELTGSPPPALPQATPEAMRARLANRARRLLDALDEVPADMAVAALVEFVEAACDALKQRDARARLLNALIPKVAPTALGPTAPADSASTVAVTTRGTAGAPLIEKYRPLRFAEVVGNPAAVRTLMNFAGVKRKKTMLFCGPTGTGKTTLAWVYASSALCSRNGPNDVEPCGGCESCERAATRSPVVTFGGIAELSAAAVDSKDAAEAVIESINGQADAVIVNEADRLLSHQLRLIATLDRNPGRLIILCTTKPEKFEPEVQGRCDVVRLAPVAQTEMEAYVSAVARSEGSPCDPPDIRSFLDGIGEPRRGQVRDVLQELDRVLVARKARPPA